MSQPVDERTATLETLVAVMDIRVGNMESIITTRIDTLDKTMEKFDRTLEKMNNEFVHQNDVKGIVADAREKSNKLYVIKYYYKPALYRHIHIFPKPFMIYHTISIAFNYIDHRV